NLGMRDLHALAGWSRKIAGEDRDQRSIIDALDDLSNRKKWPRHELDLSQHGQQRLMQLGRQLRELRSRTGLRLQDLVAEVERALLFDIEFAIDPLRSAQSRHHLEQFRQVAARYEATGGTGAPVTLGGFLDWLEVASAEERGLPVTNVNPSAEAVQLLTIHAAKGLEWDVVAVSGLVEGTFPSCRAPQDPTKPVRNQGWLMDHGAVPFDLRGDADGLPEFLGHGATDTDTFKEMVEEFLIAAGDYEISEERRLAYVAFTRARRTLLLTGSWWAAGRKTASRPSRFITELVRARVADGGWDSDSVHATNPMDEVERTAQWPPDHTGRLHPNLLAAAKRVEELIATSTELPLSIDRAESEEIATWYRHADLLVAEERAAAAPERAIELPSHLSASALVALVQDASAFALMRRRPVPQQPTPRSRLGTAFHAWVERLYGTPALVDLDDLPGEQMQLDDNLDALKEVFTHSQWAQRQPIALEIDLETPIADTTIRCRIDAVFEEPDGTVLIVDWKTGQPPAIGSDAHRQRSLQLAVYRLAWSRLHDVDIDDIRAIFVHVSPRGITEVESLDLSDQEIAEMLAGSAPDGWLAFA
ncbi:MAG TPA: 3'-5' exonuclease, partial [Actinomycetales bacterium]|nr:3'-5' exonuclease [Actinomycetales bacterium]